MTISELNNGMIATGLGMALLSYIIASESMEDSSSKKIESFKNGREEFYNDNPAANGVRSNNIYRGPNGSLPRGQQKVSLNTSGDQLLSYQIYQQAVNAATPTKEQLDSISVNPKTKLVWELNN